MKIFAAKYLNGVFTSVGFSHSMLYFNKKKIVVLLQKERFLKRFDESQKSLRDSLQQYFYHTYRNTIFGFL